MYQIPDLPYLYQDLEPFIDTHTVGIHYHKHEKNYLNKLNELLSRTNYDYRYDLDELIYHINEFPISSREDILYNLGGVLNHILYWQSMKGNKRYKPAGQLAIQIDNSFGSYEGFWKLFKEKALQLKGSGYTFLVMDSNGKLEIINTHNQDTPIMLGYVPLFNVDMWEHAYYLNYKNEKGKYLDNFEQIADFEHANYLYNTMMS